MLNSESEFETNFAPDIAAVTGAHKSINPVRHPFRLTDTAVEFAEEKDGSTEWQFVCSRLEVVAMTRSETREDWGRLLRFRDRDSREHEWSMPMEMLAGDGSAYRERLLSMGLIIAPGNRARDRLHQYIASTTPSARARAVSRIGWYRDSFVFPDVVIGDTGTERLLYQSTTAIDHAFRTCGTLEDWQREVAFSCAGNSRLAFALCTAFAVPLLGPMGEESGGFNLVGPSSIGKTTALEVAGSVWGGGPHGYIRQWRATANGLEAVAVLHCDVLLALDEIAQISSREAGEVAYLLANGQGKSRARRDGSGRPPVTWRTLFLSSGEISLADKVSEDGRRQATAGQHVRVVDIPADAGAGLGLLEDLHGSADGQTFVLSSSR